MRAINFTVELAVYIRINTSPNALTVQIAKNRKKILFLTRQLCHGAFSMSRKAEISKIQHGVF